MLLTACDDMHAHLYDVEHASLIEAFSGTCRPLSSFEVAQVLWASRQAYAWLARANAAGICLLFCCQAVNEVEQRIGSALQGMSHGC